MKLETMLFLMLMTPIAQAQVPVQGYQRSVQLCNAECFRGLYIKSNFSLRRINKSVGKIATGNALMVVGTLGTVGSTIAGVAGGAVALANETDATPVLASSIISGVISLVLTFTGLYVSSTGHDLLTATLTKGPTLGFEPFEQAPPAASSPLPPAGYQQPSPAHYPTSLPELTPPPSLPKPSVPPIRPAPPTKDSSGQSLPDGFDKPTSGDDEYEDDDL